jgi:hypothetical protein
MQSSEQTPYSSTLLTASYWWQMSQIGAWAGEDG